MSVYQETSLNLSEKTYPVMNPILIPRGQVTGKPYASPAIIECVREELPRLTSARVQSSSAGRQEHNGAPYLKQIAAAQQFLDENRNADLAHVKCLLRRMIPEEYHGEIEKLHEREDPKFVCIINGGQNLIAPNARQAEQTIQDSIPEK